MSIHRSDKGLTCHVLASEDSESFYCSTKAEKTQSNVEKLFVNLLNKDKFILKSNFDEESSKIFLQEKNESLKNVILNDILPEDYKIVKASNFFIPPTKIININEFETYIRSKIYCNDPLEISFRKNNNVNNKSHRTIEWEIDNQFSFRNINGKKE